jgi:hypothetical protein
VSRVWYVTPDRQPVDWVTILSGGRTVSAILRVVGYSDRNDPTVVSYVWKAADASVSRDEITKARAETRDGNSERDYSDPYNAVPPHPSTWNPPRGRYISAYELEKRLRQFDADEDAEDNATYYTKLETDQRLDALIRTLGGNAEDTAALILELRDTRVRANAAWSLASDLDTLVRSMSAEIAAARGTYPTLAARLAAGNIGGGTNPGTGGGDTGTDDLAFYVSDGFLIGNSASTKGLELVGMTADGEPYYDSAGAENPFSTINLVDEYPYFDGSSTAPNPGTGEGTTPYLVMDAAGYVFANTDGAAGIGLIGADSNSLPYFDSAGASDPVTSVDFVNVPLSVLSRFA